MIYAANLDEDGFADPSSVSYYTLVAARAAGVDVYDTPFTDVNDDEGIEVDALLAKSLGFSGKASISPRHVDVINQVFSPTQKEIDYAYEVMDAIAEAKAQGKGAIALHGKMIDAPIVARAQQTIAMAVELGLGTTYVGVFEPDTLLEKFPEMAGLVPIALLPIGYAAENAKPAPLHTQYRSFADTITEI